MNHINVVFVLADQWRAQATGYSGDPNVQTPHLDALAQKSLNFSQAVSGCPVCSPYRGSLMTGQYPLRHGVFVNDVQLNPEAITMGKLFLAAGYATAYIGKWHLDGRGRSSYIPPKRRQGFTYWKALECTHDYNHSAYYSGDSEEKLYWEGYDAIAQTRDACTFLRSRKKDTPFLLVLSWGPPHNPYETAPEPFKALYKPKDIQLRPNVPDSSAADARVWLAGYYAHCTALDECIGALMETLHETGLADNTLFVFTSDHGDMLGSHGEQRKQRPWDESIRVPFLLWCPETLKARPPGNYTVPLNTPDILPTLLGLCGLPIPETVEGLDYSGYVRGGMDPSDGSALLMCVHPFGEWAANQGGRAYRGIRTAHYTYTRDLDEPWLLYDNVTDPYQQNNLVSDPKYKDILAELDEKLSKKLVVLGDDFLPGMDYIKKWGYTTDETGTVPYHM